MWNKAKTALLTITLIGAFLTVFFSVYLGTLLVNEQGNAPLFWYASCGTGWPLNTGSICGYHGQVSLPPSFEMTSGPQPPTTVFEHVFSIWLNSSSKVSFQFKATAPINFQLLLDERESSGIPDLASEALRVIVNETQTTSLSSLFYAKDSGLYVFLFSPVESNPFATVAFDVTI